MALNCLFVCLLKIVSKYAFNKDKYESDPDCDIDFETMRWVAGLCNHGVSN